MKLKAQLQHYLQIRDMTPTELARKSGTSKQVIASWLNGAEPKKFAQVKAVATALNVSIDNLLYGNGSETEAQKTIELESLLSDSWLSGVFEIKMRRLKR